MRFVRSKRWRWPRSLRFRLMVWNATVVMVTACVTLIALREGVRITLIRELDQLLRDDIQEIELALDEHTAAQELHRQLDRKDAGHTRHHKWFAELIDERNGDSSYRSLHAPATNVWASVGTAAVTVDEWRLMSVERPDHGITVRVGASLHLIRADIARLDRIVVLAGCGVLFVAPLCGYWLALRATRPLTQIISTTARMRPTQLHERLTIRGTGDELDQLSATINDLLNRIGRYLQDHRDFLANSAHELRTPLAAIHASIEVALAGSRTNEEYRELLSEIIEESSSLEVMVNQLLLLSETEAERLKVEPHPVRFDELVTKAVDMFSGVAEYRDIQLSAGNLPAVSVDGNRQHLRHVINNLVDNALKFTPGGGEVRVDLSMEIDTGMCHFIVEDTGVGIAQEELQHVFDRFFRGNRPRAVGHEARGTGLGLSICQAVVRAHGGTITVTSEVGKGTKFVVRLPLAREAGMPMTEAISNQSDMIVS